MPQRKVRINFSDEEGSNYTVTLDGIVSRNKVLKIIDKMELLGGNETNESPLSSTETTFGKLYELIETSFPLGNFNSADMLEAYEDKYHKPIKISTISTYLSRFKDKGLLHRQRGINGWNYKRLRVNSKEQSI